MSEAVSAEVDAWSRAVELYRSGADLQALWPVLQQAEDDLALLREVVVQREASRETWKTIGAILGVSRQAAAKRYGSVRL